MKHTKSIHTYHSKLEELGKLADAHDLINYSIKQPKFEKLAPKLKEKIEDNITKTMINIKSDTTNMFFVKRIRRFFAKFKYQLNPQQNKVADQPNLNNTQKF